MKARPCHEEAENSRLSLQTPETRGHPVSNDMLSEPTRLKCWQIADGVAWRGWKLDECSLQGSSALSREDSGKSAQLAET